MPLKVLLYVRRLDRFDSKNADLGAIPAERSENAYLAGCDVYSGMFDLIEHPSRFFQVRNHLEIASLLLLSG